LLPRLPEGTRVIGNPFDDALFGKPYSGARTRELVFLGRLIPEKGLDLLLEALVLLGQKGIYPALTVIGAGPDEQRCRKITAGLQHQSRISFVGAKRGAELAHLLSVHQVLVVPSRLVEPFGVVALEGIACGCVAIGSDRGGLPEAIGPCGFTFPSNDVTGLAACIKNVLADPSAAERCRAHAHSHLSRFSRRAVAEQYLQVFGEVTV
jgi:glycosyltransferase involved in cell wall biosynthesis